MYTVRLFKEPEVNVDISAIAENLNKRSESVTFVCGDSHFVLADKVVTYPGSHGNLNASIIKETEKDFKAILCHTETLR